MAGAIIYSRFNRFLYFCDLLEDDRSKISHTKVAAWAAVLLNYVTITYQFIQDHPNAPVLVATTLAHITAAVKHEFKRRAP